jgi:hypothetical protein
MAYTLPAHVDTRPEATTPGPDIVGGHIASSRA